MNEILELPFVMPGRDSDILKDFPLYREYRIWLTNGKTVNLIILYNSEDKKRTPSCQTTWKVMIFGGM